MPIPVPAWLGSLVGSVLALSVGATEADWGKVDQALGRKGVELAGGIHKYVFPRSDLKVSVDGVAIKPALALGSWVAFLPEPSGAMFMGDLVLTDTELSTVMRQLIESGVEITAVHNHLLRMTVPVFYMHVGGHGDPVRLAEALRAALALSQTPLQLAASAPPPTVDLDTARIDKALGFKGNVNGGVYRVSVPRAEVISQGGMAPPPPSPANRRGSGITGTPGFSSR
jgi:hypothetical protein